MPQKNTLVLVDGQEAPKELYAQNIIRNNVLWSIGAGAVPVPIFDLAAITVVQIKMIYELSRLYEVPFNRSLVANLIASLVGSAGSVIPGGIIALGFIKLVPVVGMVGGLASIPTAAAAATYAVGQTFLMHFESGGTLLTFEPEKVKEFYAEQLAEGKKVAKNASKKS